MDALAPKPGRAGDVESGAAAPPCGEPEDLRLELAAAYAELQKVERMRESMLAILGHELRTPLFAAQLAAAELAPAEDGRRRSVHQHLLRNLERLQAAVEQIMTDARLAAGLPPQALKPTDLAALVSAQAEAARPAAEADGQSLTLKVRGDARPVRADESELGGAVGQLLRNAIRFNRPRGRVRASLQFGFDEAELEVADDGDGVPAAESEKIFDSYYQVAAFMTRRVGGLGLGLAIARKTFESHGGTLQYLPGLDGGSVFRATLPLLKPP